MINGTLFIQIINFIVAYYCLKNIIFKDGLSVITSISERDNALQQSIVSAHVIIKDLVDKKNSEWQNFMQVVSTHKPSMAGAYTVERNVQVPYEAQNIEIDQEKELIGAMREVIIKKVLHDD